jgi:hypothetical protein
MLLLLGEVVMRIDSLQLQRRRVLSSPYTACLTSASTRSNISLRLCSANCCAQFKSRR